MRIAACLLFFLSLPARADDTHDRVSFEVERVIDLATLKADRAIALRGRKAVFRVTIDTDTEPEEGAGWVSRDCLPSKPHLATTVVLPAGSDETRQTFIVEGTLRVRQLPGFRGPGGPVPPMTHLVLRASRVR